VLGAGAEPVALHTQEWESGAVSPRGHVHIESFELDGLVPVWRFALPGGLLEKRVWMEQGAHTTYVTYRLVRAAPGTSWRIVLRPLCTWRDHHTLTRSHEVPQLDPLVAGDGVQIGFAGAPPCVVRAGGAAVDTAGEHHRGFLLRAETERGMDDVQDLYAAGTLTVPLVGGSAVTVTISLDRAAATAPAPDSDALMRVERARTDALLARSRIHTPPPWIARLLIAADQFLASRAGLATVLAGFPWFGD
jgi:hypothetical protein